MKTFICILLLSLSGCVTAPASLGEWPSKGGMELARIHCEKPDTPALDPIVFEPDDTDTLFVTTCKELLKHLRLTVNL